ncbi:MAG: aromatic amino acid transport family protein [Patescibacteria group bacterium]
MITPSTITDKKIVLHQGVYKPIATVSEAVFMITGMTIGAGVLGMPYVISKVGLLIGILYIIVIGLVMLGLNLMIGEVALKTDEQLQLPGLSGRYLGNWAKYLSSFLFIFGAYGSLLVFIVGEGESLSALFGGNPIWWGVFFWSLGSFFIWRGLRMIKIFEKIIGSIVIFILAALSIFLLTKVQVTNLFYINTANIFLPLGVIMFALSNSAAVVEAHALLPGSQRHFRKALIIGTLIPIVLYILFAVAVVGVSGLNTTEVATIGLGEIFGNAVLVAGNLLAILAMGTGFVGIGIVLKQTFIWDNKLNKVLAEFLVIFLPLAAYLAGIRNFVGILGIMGGLGFSSYSIILVLACWRAHKVGGLDTSRYNLRHFWLLTVPLFLIFTLVFVYSLLALF